MLSVSNIQKTILTIFLLSVYTEFAWSTTRYVQSTGDDISGTNDCSLDTSPCLTITNAITQSTAGDEVWVAGGTYQVDSSGGTQVQMQPGINVLGGYDPADWGVRDWNTYITTIEDLSTATAAYNDPNRAVEFLVAGSSELSGFNIVGGGGSFSYAVFVDGGDGVIHHNRMYGGTGSSQTGAILLESGNTTVFNSLLFGNTYASKIHNSGTVGTFYNNTMYSQSITIEVVQSAQVGLANNVLIGSSYCIHENNADADVTLLQNNAFSGCATVIHDEAANDYAAAQWYVLNDANTTTQGAVNTAEGNIYSSVTFTDVDGVDGDITTMADNDWSLAAPVDVNLAQGGIDGSASSWVFSNDFNGIARTNATPDSPFYNGAGGWTMGAIEYDMAVVSPKPTLFSQQSGDLSDKSTWSAGPCGVSNNTITVIPDATTDIVICDNTTVTLDSDSNVQSAIVGSDSDAAGATFDTAGFDLTLSGDLTIGDGDSTVAGTATFNETASDIIISGDFSMASDATVNSTAGLNVAGNLSKDAASVVNANITLIGSGKITSNGGNDYPALILNSAGNTYTLADDLYVNVLKIAAGTLDTDSAYDREMFVSGSIAIGNGDANQAILFANNSDINIGGDWSLNNTDGEFNVVGAGVILDGTVDQSVNGTNAFYGLTLADTGSRTITFPANDTTTVNGAFTADASTNGIILDSSDNSNQFTLDLKGSTGTLSNLVVNNSLAQSSNSSVSLPLSTANSTDGGNTNNWFGYFAVADGQYATAATWVTDGCSGSSVAGSAPINGNEDVAICSGVTVDNDSVSGANSLSVLGTLNSNVDFTVIDSVDVSGGVLYTNGDFSVGNKATLSAGSIQVAASTYFKADTFDHIDSTAVIYDSATLEVNNYNKTGATSSLVIGGTAPATLIVNALFTHTGGAITPYTGSTMSGTALDHTSGLFYKGSFTTATTPNASQYFYELSDGSQPFEVEVVDPSLNLSCTVQDSVTLTVTTTAGESETLTLTETGNATGVFQDSTLPFALATVATGDAAIQGSRDDILTFTYTDPYNASDTNSYQTLLTDYLMPTVVSRETRDIDSNGKIDSILMVLEYAASQSCSGLSVDVTDYSVRSYSSCSETDDYFIVHLDELSGNCTVEDTSSCDTGVTPDVQVTSGDTASPIFIGTNVDIGDMRMSLLYSEPVFSLGGSAVSTADFQYYDLSLSGASAIRNVSSSGNELRLDSNASFTFNDTKSDKLFIARLQDAAGNTISSTETEIVDPEFDPGIAIDNAKLSDNYLDYRKSRTTTIGFNLSKSGNVNIELLDLKGRKVKKLHSQRYSAGLQYYEWAPGSIRPGLYYVKVYADGWSEPQLVRVMIIR